MRNETLSTSAPAPESGVVDKTSIVGRTTVVLEPAGAAEVLSANAEGAPSAKPATAVDKQRTKQFTPLISLPAHSFRPL